MILVELSVTSGLCEDVIRTLTCVQVCVVCMYVCLHVRTRVRS